MPTRYLPHAALLPTVLFITGFVGKSMLYPDNLLATPMGVPPLVLAYQDTSELDCVYMPALAPPRLYMGPMAGVVFAHHTDAIASTQLSGLQANGNTATGTGWNIGWQIWYILGDVKAAEHSLAADVHCVFMPGKVESTVSTPLAFGEPNATRAQAKYEKEIDYAVISMDMLYNYRVMRSRFCLMAGPSVGIVVGSEQRERLSLLDDDASVRFTANEESQKRGVQFENDNRVAMSKGDIPERNALRMSLKSGVAYESSMIRKMLIVPYALYEYPLRPANSESAWGASAFHLGVQLHLAL